MLVMKQVSFLSSSNPIRVLSNAYLRGWIATERILFHVIIYKHDITVLHFTVNSTALGIAFSIKATIKLSMCLHEAPRFKDLGGGECSFGSTHLELPPDLRPRPHCVPEQSAWNLMNTFVRAPYGWFTCFLQKMKISFSFLIPRIETGFLDHPEASLEQF